MSVFVNKNLPAFLFILLIGVFPSCKQKIENKLSTKELQNAIETATVKLHTNNPKSAISYLDSVYSSKNSVSLYDRFKFYSFFCDYYISVKKYNEALKYADKMLLEIESSDNRDLYAKELAEANYVKGDILFYLKDYNKAYQYFYEAKLIGKNTFDDCTLSEYSYRLGRILYKQEKYKTSAGFFKQAFKESSICEQNFYRFYRRQEILNNTALCYYRANLTDSALIYFNNALALIKLNASKYQSKASLMDIAQGVIYGNKAQLYQLKGDYAQAIALYNKSIDINNNPKCDYHDAYLQQMHLAGMYLKINQPDKAYALLQQVKSELSISSGDDTKLLWNRTMLNYYQTINDIPKAYQYLLLLNTIEDSLSKSLSGLNNTDAKQQVNNLEKDYNYSFLRKTDLLNKIYLKLALIGVILCMVIGIIVYLTWRKSKQNISQLTDLNNQVISQKNRLEQSLIELERRANEKDRILRVVAHDLRNPIGGVASLSNIFLEEPDLPEEHKEMLQLIESTCVDALELINEILEISVLSNLENMPKEEIEMNSMVNNAVELLRFKAIDKKQNLIFLPLFSAKTISVNREKLSRVISNLIGNAIKFSPSGSDITIMISEQQGCIQIAIKDEGIGIPDNIKNKVFDTFTEAKRPGTSGEKPFGLGLSICKQIIEAHSGKIWFESEAGKGSTFFIELLDDFNSVPTIQKASGTFA